MFRFRSLLSRILFLHVVAMVVTATIMPLLLYWFFSSDVEGLQQRTLQAQAEALVRHLKVHRDGAWSLDLPAGLRDQYSEAYGRYGYAVLDDQERVLFSSRKEAKPIFQTNAGTAEVQFFEEQHGGRTVIGASVRKRVGERTIWIQVAEDLAHRDVLVDDVVANFLRSVGWITVPVLLLLLATDVIIFRRAIQPLLRASARAEHISPTRIDLRLPLADIPTEIVPLVTAVNQAFDRLEDGFRRQREFTADVAHELRTPLSILRMRIDTLPDQRSAKALHRDIEGMSRVVSQLLDAAEIETLLVGAHERADLHAVCVEVAEALAPVALAQGKAIALSGAAGPIWIRGNAEMLVLAVRNLVENAIKHTPGASDIDIVLGAQGTISVLDQGEGIPLAKREKIFERFWRRDRDRMAGAGLGLSIVRRIVEAHGATITVENRSTGGTDFTMRFSPADPPDRPSAGAREGQSVPG